MAVAPPSAARARRVTASVRSAANSAHTARRRARAEAHEPAAPPLAAHGVDDVIIAGVARRIEARRTGAEGDRPARAQLDDEALGRGARDGDVDARRDAVARADEPRPGDGAIDAYCGGGAARQEGCPNHLLSSSCMAHGCCPYVQVRNSAADFDR